MFVLVDEIPGHIQPGAPIEIAYIHDQGVAIPAAARVSIPRPVALRMRAVVGGNDADVVHGFVEKRHVLLVLDDLDRVEPAGLIKGAGNSRQMTARFGIFVPSF
jgi:hypothetical protein